MREFGTFPVFAVNVTEVAPAGTVTVAGKVIRLLAEDTLIALPPAGAGLLSVMTQVLALYDRNEVGLHVNDARAADEGGAVTMRVALCEVPE
jgi:hypothetical protein